MCMVVHFLLKTTQENTIYATHISPFSTDLLDWNVAPHRP